MQRRVPERLRVRAVWLSDIHLGYKDCKAGFLLDFLARIECETLYLVGDIVDIWSMSRSFCWPAEHNQVLRALMQMARAGCRVIYIPGNHDQTFREYVDECFGAVEIQLSAVHEMLDGRRLLVLHGDELDSVVQFSWFARHAGDAAYDFLLFINRFWHRIRSFFGLPYWSLAGYLKLRIQNATRIIDSFERAALHLAQERGFDGIVCGHIHHPNIRHWQGRVYCNDGDWIENCTALVETRSGELQILHWADSGQIIDTQDNRQTSAA